MRPVGKDFNHGCLRSLSETDVDGMLEWMHDPDITDKFNKAFSDTTKDEALEFIKASWNDPCSFHFAVTNNAGEYLGTISLKSIDNYNQSAEYAISMRKSSHGSGAAMHATKDLLSYAFELLGLERVYLNVKSTNLRAINFYRKCDFIKEGVSRNALKISDDEFIDLLWFSILREEYITTLD